MAAPLDLPLLVRQLQPQFRIPPESCLAVNWPTASPSHRYACSALVALPQFSGDSKASTLQQ